MGKKIYHAGIVFTGDGKGGVQAIVQNQKALNRLNKTYSKTRKGVRSISKELAGMRRTMYAVGGIVAMGRSLTGLIDAFEIQEQAVAKLDASINSMGRTTTGLSEELQDLASQIQREGILGDEAIIEGQSFLTTYREITDEMLPEATRVMVDLAAKMGGNVTSAANMVGKAAMGMSGELRKVGITIDPVIAKSGDFAAILKELDKQVGGTNRALGETASGGIKQMEMAWGDLQEQLGQVVAIGLTGYLRDWSTEMKLNKGAVDEWGQSLKETIGYLIEHKDEVGAIAAAAAAFRFTPGPLPVKALAAAGTAGYAYSNTGTLSWMTSRNEAPGEMQSLTDVENALAVAERERMYLKGVTRNYQEEVQELFGAAENNPLGRWLAEWTTPEGWILGSVEDMDQRIDALQQRKKELQQAQAEEDRLRRDMGINTLGNVDVLAEPEVGYGLDPKEWEKRQKAVEDGILGTLPLYEQLRQKADAWRDAQLQGLDEGSRGYVEFAADVETVYHSMLEKSVEAERKAAEERMQASTDWKDHAIMALREYEDNARNIADEVGDAFTRNMQSMEDALVEFVKTGKLDFSSLADSIISDLIRIQVRQSITGPLSGMLKTFVNGLTGGGGEVWSEENLMMVPANHSGGIVGSEGAGRYVHPAVFADAPRLHTGGLAGSEVPAILKRGEGVFTEGQMKALGMSRSQNIKVEVVNKGTPQQANNTDVRFDGKDMVVRIFTEDLSRNGPMARSIATNFTPRRSF